MFGIFTIYTENNTFVDQFSPVSVHKYLFSFPAAVPGFPRRKTNSFQSVPTGKQQQGEAYLYTCTMKSSTVVPALSFDLFGRHGLRQRKKKSKPSLCVISRPRMFTSRQNGTVENSLRHQQVPNRLRSKGIG